MADLRVDRSHRIRHGQGQGSAGHHARRIRGATRTPASGLRDAPALPGWVTGDLPCAARMRSPAILGTSAMESIGKGAAMTERFPYELRLPLAPYRFEWRDEAAVGASKHATDAYSEERYTHADGTTTVIREYRSDGTFHVMSDRGEIELIDNAQDPYSADPVSVVRLP